MAEKDNPSNIQELSKYVQKVKEMKIADRKQLLDWHTNIATYIMQVQKEIDFSQMYQLEQEIIQGTDFKEVMPRLEAKMARQCSIHAVLRLLCLLCVTKSGFDQKEFDYVRKTFTACYGYQEIPTLMNLHDAKILRPRDKTIDWSKIKKVSGTALIRLELQFDQRRCQD